MTAQASPRRFFSLTVFVCAVVLVYAADLLVVSRMSRAQQPDVLALGVTLDLVVVVPLLAYLLLVRWRGWSPFVLVPAFLLSLAAAGAIVPAGHQDLLRVLKWLVVPLELAVIGTILVKVGQATRHVRAHRGQGDAGDLFERVLGAAREVAGQGFVAHALAFEVAISTFALAGWRMRPSSAAESYSIHRRVGYGAVVCALLMALAAEAIALHVLVERWSAVAAWVLTALSVYSVFWVVGDYHAVRLRPIRLEKDGILIRVGLRWRVWVPFAAVAAVRKLRPGAVLPRRKDRLDAVVLKGAQYLLFLERPVIAEGPYGIEREVVQIAFGVDEPARFAAQLQDRLGREIEPAEKSPFC